jgi:hypothetical protein
MYIFITRVTKHIIALLALLGGDLKITLSYGTIQKCINFVEMMECKTIQRCMVYKKVTWMHMAK